MFERGRKGSISEVVIAEMILEIPEATLKILKKI